ncbi:adenylyl-sulfate kinase, partial [Ancylostoma duodenale]
MAKIRPAAVTPRYACSESAEIHFSTGATNVTYQQHKTGREERASVLGKHDGFRGCTIWFTGLSGAGKTTIAFAVEKLLTQMGIPCCGLDGDNVRHGLCKNLGFSKEERSENIRSETEIIDTESEGHGVDRCVATVIEFLHKKGIIPDKAMRQLSGPPLRELFVESAEERKTLLEEAKNMPKIELGPVEVQWLQVLSEGWATPLPGFMRERQYLQALHFGQLLDLKKKTVFPGEKDDGAEDPWPMDEPVNQSIPIVLPITDEQKENLCKGEEVSPRVALTRNGAVLAILCDGEIYAHRREERVARQFAFSDPRHPTVEQILSSGPWCLGGDLKVLERVTFDDGLNDFRKTPSELRRIFEEK